MAWLLLFLMVSMLLPVHVTLADDALVLPQGRWRITAETRFSLPITKRFTPGGGTEDLAADFNREITSTTFPDLRLVAIHEGAPSLPSLPVASRSWSGSPLSPGADAVFKARPARCARGREGFPEKEAR